MYVDLPDFFIGENEDAINQAREAFHAHLSKVKGRKSSLTTLMRNF